MPIFSSITDQSVSDFARAMLNAHRGDLTSFETAAQMICQTVYESYTDDAGQPLFALVRVFRVGSAADAPPDVTLPPDETSRYWVSLAGTAGVEAAWNHRQKSQGHSAIPERMARQAPMLRALFGQIGLHWGESEGRSLKIQYAEDLRVNYFYIPQALGSPYIVAQSDFVEPYGIKSVIGFGDAFLIDAAYVCVLFSRAEIDQTRADALVKMAPFVGTLLALCQKVAIWSA
jgi:hypothetical protein